MRDQSHPASGHHQARHIYRLEPTKAFALPGMFGMLETDQSNKPPRWTFADD